VTEEHRQQGDERAEEVAERERELLDQVHSAGSAELPDVPELRYERPKASPESQALGGTMGTNRAAALAMTVLYAMVGPPVVGLLLGMWIDNKYHTAPFWTSVCFMIGAGGGLALMIRLLLKLSRDEDR
jgi:F0F1-type ATP synthase assembly protein I